MLVAAALGIDAPLQTPKTLTQMFRRLGDELLDDFPAALLEGSGVLSGEIGPLVEIEVGVAGRLHEDSRVMG